MVKTFVSMDNALSLVCKSFSKKKFFDLLLLKVVSHICDQSVENEREVPRSITPGRKRPFFIVFDSFHMRSITAGFCRTVYGY